MDVIEKRHLLEAANNLHAVTKKTLLTQPECSMKLSECFPDNKAVYISIPLATVDECQSLLEPLKRNKYSFAIITTVKGYVVIREPENDDEPAMVNEFTNKMQIVRYWRRGEEMIIG